VTLNENNFQIIGLIIKTSIYLSLPILIYIFTATFERKLCSRTVGKMGRHQSRGRDYLTFLQDLIKIFLKTPISYNVTSFLRLNLSPAVAFGISVLPVSVIPICESFLLNNQKMAAEILVSRYSLLLFLGLNSLNIFSAILVGWGVNSNFSILSNLKKSMHYLATEMIVYFIIINMIITYGTADFHDIVIMQKRHLFGFVNQLGLFIQPVLAIVFMYYITVTSSFQNSKFSFDLKHSQSGTSLSLNSIGLILLKLTEQVKYFISAILFSFLFLGGYGLLPGLSFLVEQYSDSLYFFQITSLLAKTIIVTSLGVVLKQSTFNMRADQVLTHAWKEIIPVLYLISVITIIFMIVSGRFKWI
jgi:NADH-quinone oxidoreductase subunit H